MEERIKSYFLENDKEAKYDIRDWDSEHKKMGKGVTLTSEELKKLKVYLMGWSRKKYLDLKKKYFIIKITGGPFYEEL
jgi:hypothetical protein